MAGASRVRRAPGLPHHAVRTLRCVQQKAGPATPATTPKQRATLDLLVSGSNADQGELLLAHRPAAVGLHAGLARAIPLAFVNPASDARPT